jgi:hypothetical protein
MTQAVEDHAGLAITEPLVPIGHKVCKVCYPNALNAGPFEIKGICGADLLGIFPPPDGYKVCEPCMAQLPDHLEDHWQHRGDE